MDSNKKEFAEIGRTHGAVITDGELKTAAVLAGLDHAAACRARLTAEERQAQTSALYDLITTPADREAVRASYWNKLSPAARSICVQAGQLDKKRFNDALAGFNALERGLINMRLEILIRELETARKCMNGGHMPSKGEVH